ncbi:MAG TPA: HAD family hydrolase [Myxococcota bacterium]|nr:HAD family hydrolase [Myxococcota bacterium]
MNVAAFFDLDKTLLTVNSGRLWMQCERRDGRLSGWHMAEAALYFVAYRFGLIDMEYAMGRALKTIRGLEEDVLRRRTRAWFTDEVLKYAAPGARAAIAGHRGQGHRLVLLTSSSPYESEAAAEFFGLEDFLCTRYEVTDGLFTGEAIKPLCYGAGKVEYARRWAREHDVDLATSYFYSDSITDLPMLQAVGNPRIVAPDPRLKHQARKNGWPVLDWSAG